MLCMCLQPCVYCDCCSTVVITSSLATIICLFPICAGTYIVCKLHQLITCMYRCGVQLSNKMFSIIYRSFVFSWFNFVSVCFIFYKCWLCCRLIHRLHFTCSHFKFMRSQFCSLHCEYYKFSK